LYLTVREEHRLKVSENRALRRAFGPKKDEAIIDWRELHSNLYCLPNTLIVQGELEGQGM
jgi:hypothetical protein